MIWYICLVVAAAAIVRAVWIMAGKRESRFRLPKMFLYVIAAAYIAYLPVFLKQYAPIDGLFGNIHHTMQMVSLDASYTEYYDMVRESMGGGAVFRLYMLFLSFMHIAVPVAAIATAYDCVVNFLGYLRIFFINWRAADIYVFSQFDDTTLGLAKDIARRSRKKSAFIFANTSEDQDKNSSILEMLGGSTFVSDKIEYINIRFRKNRRVYFFNLSPVSDENVDSAVKLIEKYKKLPEEQQRLTEIFVLSDVPDTDVVIDSMDKGLLGMHIYDFNRLSCYELFDIHPLFSGIENGTLSLLVCGSGKMGEEVLKAAVWLGQLDNVRLKINMVDAGASACESRLRLSCPELFSGDYALSFFDCAADSPEFAGLLKDELSDTTYAVVCGGDDEDNIQTAVYLRRSFLRNDPQKRKKPVIAVRIYNSEKTGIVRSMRTSDAREERRVAYDLVPFGGRNTICDYNSLLNSPIENLTKNVNLAYDRIFSPDGEADPIESLKRYNLLEYNKSSNRANTMHIRYKLWMLGLDYTDDENAPEADFYKYLTDEALERMTRLEHDRWMAFLRTEGWVTASIDEADCFKKAGLSGGRHNSQLLKMHPYICPFNDLPEISKALGLPDARVYDRELIRRIPEILSSTAYSDCNYKIVKRTGSQ